MHLRQNNINEKEHLFPELESNMNISYRDTQIKLSSIHTFPGRLKLGYLDILLIKVLILVSQLF